MSLAPKRFTKSPRNRQTNDWPPQDRPGGLIDLSKHIGNVGYITSNKTRSGQVLTVLEVTVKHPQTDGNHRWGNIRLDMEFVPSRTSNHGSRHGDISSINEVSIGRTIRQSYPAGRRPIPEKAWTTLIFVPRSCERVACQVMQALEGGAATPVESRAQTAGGDRPVGGTQPGIAPVGSRRVRYRGHRSSPENMAPPSEHQTRHASSGHLSHGPDWRASSRPGAGSTQPRRNPLTTIPREGP